MIYLRWRAALGLCPKPRNIGALPQTDYYWGSAPNPGIFRNREAMPPAKVVFLL